MYLRTSVTANDRVFHKIDLSLKLLVNKLHKNAEKVGLQLKFLKLLATAVVVVYAHYDNVWHFPTYEGDMLVFMIMPVTFLHKDFTESISQKF